MIFLPNDVKYKDNNKSVCERIFFYAFNKLNYLVSFFLYKFYLFHGFYCVKFLNIFLWISFLIFYIKDNALKLLKMKVHSDESELKLLNIKQKIKIFRSVA